MQELPGGMVCRHCGREVKTGLVFLCSPKAWIPFCPKCLYDAKKRIAVAIAATGLSEEELAERIKVSKTTLRSWKTGRVKRPKRENLEHLAAMAGVSLGWLEGKEDSPSRP